MVRLAETAAPGRICPAGYGYCATVFDRPPEIVADTLYVVGGLYGNEAALDALEALLAREPGPARVVFNGDFHWFDLDPATFARIDDRVAGHGALAGNVETELAADDDGAGCGCAYPADVDEATVLRSNRILARLRLTARRFASRRRRLAALPRHGVARVGDARIAIVHGDAESLAGWRFGIDALDDPGQADWRAAVFAQAGVDVFACSHTCLPAMRCFDLAGRPVAVANNGAAGMPNFAASAFGLVTRIGIAPSPTPALYGLALAGVHVEAVPLRYEAARWAQRFLADWPAGSDAHASYWPRIAAGLRHTLDQAAPAAPGAPARPADEGRCGALAAL